MGEITFDYYYGGASEQYAFYRIPRLLITGRQFRGLSTDAKLLYGLMLDRMSLSAKNDWYDPLGRVFIYFSLDDIQEAMFCGHEKAVKLLAELDTGKGIGLIERVKQGQGRPAIIYVKQFTTQAIPTPEPPQTPVPQETPRLPIIGSQDFGKPEVKSSEKQKSRLRIIGSADFGKSDANYTYVNQLEKNQLYPSIHPSPTLPGWMDWNECFENVKFSLDYDFLCQQYDSEDVRSIAELITETLCTAQPTVRINGEPISTDAVQARFRQLHSEHIGYVLDCLKNTTTKIHNIRSYLLTALYNAPLTISHYYQAEVQHDLYGSS